MLRGLKVVVKHYLDVVSIAIVIATVVVIAKVHDPLVKIVLLSALLLVTLWVAHKLQGEAP
jgi:hypothetical protein